MMRQMRAIQDPRKVFYNRTISNKSVLQYDTRLAIDVCIEQRELVVCLNNSDYRLSTSEITIIYLLLFL